MNGGPRGRVESGCLHKALMLIRTQGGWTFLSMLPVSGWDGRES